MKFKPNRPSRYWNPVKSWSGRKNHYEADIFIDRENGKNVYTFRVNPPCGDVAAVTHSTRLYGEAGKYESLEQAASACEFYIDEMVKQHGLTKKTKELQVFHVSLGREHAIVAAESKAQVRRMLGISTDTINNFCHVSHNEEVRNLTLAHPYRVFRKKCGQETNPWVPDFPLEKAFWEIFCDELVLILTGEHEDARGLVVAYHEGDKKPIEVDLGDGTRLRYRIDEVRLIKR